LKYKWWNSQIEVKEKLPEEQPSNKSLKSKEKLNNTEKNSKNKPKILKMLVLNTEVCITFYHRKSRQRCPPKHVPFQKPNASIIQKFTS